MRYIYIYIINVWAARQNTGDHWTCGFCRRQPLLQPRREPEGDAVRLAQLDDHSLDWFVGENLNRKPWFLPSNIGLSCKFSHHPILWTMDNLWLKLLKWCWTLVCSIASLKHVDWEHRFMLPSHLCGSMWASVLDGCLLPTTVPTINQIPPSKQTITMLMLTSVVSLNTASILPIDCPVQ